MVKNLKHDVKITYFDETDALSAGASDLLDRYSALSPKLHVEYIDPGEEAAAGEVRRATAAT